MQDVITIGRRLVPIEQIAYIEPFDAASNPEFKPEKEFKARVVLLNRETVLAGMTPQQYADAYGLRMLPDDNVAVNSAVPFSVESFEPTETFKPEKPYATRLKWRDPDGIERSKLLLTAPEAVISTVMRGEAALSAARNGRVRRPRMRVSRRGQRKVELGRD